ncbi:hypothetical protein NC652_012672 [Populus alba x Populus x berolinensis]|nr:hypothetical protein NC652_012672 [Populus alba x Populus x berolinensis]
MAILALPKLKFLVFTLIFMARLCCYTGYAQVVPGQTVAKALLCLNNKIIYSGCDEAYRLTQSGNLNVPPEATDLFCNGPCLAETRSALSCINDVISDFIFYNKASVRDITYALSAGCSSTSQRGHHLGEFILLNFLDDTRGGALRSLEEGTYVLFDNGTRI